MLYEITFSCKYFNILLQCVSACAHFQLWMEASHPRMLLIYTYCKGPSCKTLFLQWRKYFVGITSYEVAAVLRKWRTEGQRTILRAGMIIDMSSTRSPTQPNPIQPWLVEYLQCVHLCGFTPVWAKEWVFKLIFWLKCSIHLLYLYFLVLSWTKNRHKNIANASPSPWNWFWSSCRGIWVHLVLPKSA